MFELTDFAANYSTPKGSNSRAGCYTDSLTSYKARADVDSVQPSNVSGAPARQEDMQQNNSGPLVMSEAGLES